MVPQVILRELARGIAKDVYRREFLGFACVLSDADFPDIQLNWHNRGLIEMYPTKEGHAFNFSWWYLTRWFDRTPRIVIKLIDGIKVIEANGMYERMPIKVRIYTEPKNTNG